MTTGTLKIFDTTLRDGEQAPGYSMDLSEKLRMAQQLARLGVDIIEAGFPVASEDDFEAVAKIAREVKGPVICGLSRAELSDIDRCWQALQHAERARIHTFIATSEIHMKHKLRKTPSEVLASAVQAVRHAKKYTDDVEFSAEDATRSDPDFVCQVFAEVIRAGATTVNVPDTVGYTTPAEFENLIRTIKANVPNIDQAVISCHCHNDLGLAVANSLAAIAAGARQAECTINGIGERAGNASMEEIVMALKVRNNRFHLETNIATELIVPTSRLLTHITGISVQPNKAVVGANAFAHEAGIHQDGMLKQPLTYEIMTPASVGLTESKLVLGKHSGRHAFRDKLAEMGFDLSDDELNEAFKNFKDLADRKKVIYDEDIEAMIAGSQIRGQESYTFEELEVTSGNKIVPKATVRLLIGGQSHKVTESGDGPVDAAFNAIRKITGFTGSLVNFSIHAVTEGGDALGEVMVAIEEKGKTVRGVGSHTDIVVASAKAYINALNRMKMFMKDGTTGTDSLKGI